MAKDPKTPPPFRFGEPEKRNWLGILLFCAFVIIGVAGIVWMIASSPRQHSLTCLPVTASGLWSSLGRCVEN